jgi:SAM-dependent methyltransferase
MTLRRLVRRSLWLSCAYYLFDDWRVGRRLARGRLETRSGSRHAGLDLAASLGYVDRVYSEYLRDGGITHFQGVVAEIGPGDNFGVALTMLAGGAQAVHAIDRYRPIRDAEHQRPIYEALAARRGFAALFNGKPGEHTIRGLTHHTGVPAEKFFRDHVGRFDAIVSRAVLEHLYDPLGALDDMVHALKSGGIMIHRIDLRDHGMFAGHHELTLLTTPSWLHRRMTRNAGRPNRVLLPDYRAWLARSGCAGSLKASRLVGRVDDIEPTPIEALEPAMLERACASVRVIRPRLAPEFRGLPDAELAISGVVMVAHRPAQGSRPSIT